MFDSGVIWLREIRCWSLLGVKGLNKLNLHNDFESGKHTETKVFCYDGSDGTVSNSPFYP